MTSRLPESDDPQRLALGRQIIKKICSVTHVPPASPEISVSDLLEVLNLSRSPAGYSLFSNSRLISGSVRLMSRLPRSQAGRHAPFSYEYGYLCFRIIILALGMSIIDRTKGYSRLLIEDMTTHLNVKPISCFSLHISRVVVDYINHATGVGRSRYTYNCVLGWLRCSDCPKMSELVSRSDASMLLRMISDDDKQFIKSMLWTYSPGLSGVVYLLWGYVRNEQYLQDHPNPNRFIVPFMIIFFRCILCSTPDQALALATIHLANFRAAQLWTYLLRPLDLRPELADSRLMMHAFIHQLNLGILPTDGERPLPIEEVPDALDFLYRHFVPGCQDIIPELIGATIQRCWVIFLNPSMMAAFPAIFTATFSWFRAFIEELRQPTLENKSLKSKVLTFAIDNDLVDFIGRIMVLINPTPPKRKDSENSEDFLKECEELRIVLSSLHPGTELENYFVARGMGWWKFYWHLRYLADLPSDDSRHAMFYNTCANTWASLRPSVNPNDLSSAIEYHMCSYDRCPNPEIPWGLGYVCITCETNVYCGTTCLQRDWELGMSRGLEGFNGSHGHALH
ncbi:Photosystem I P700 chlorophyll a apoprotein A2 [Rhizoctonia solani]|uniref:Photosystem I P700 chlorophyll a apoprotein A2 n=1 Tax=Rhizoctonia solani TaxID=456999 RepID=A0A0K6GA93_9AGAM|nr:Photosystem I P700 chlorophyll a apoprotein A2 [Rhizoctonia solani]